MLCVLTSKLIKRLGSLKLHRLHLLLLPSPPRLSQCGAVNQHLLYPFKSMHLMNSHPRNSIPSGAHRSSSAYFNYSSFQPLPTLSLMGNYISYRPPETSTGKVEVMFPNGTVHEFEGPLTVAELMLEHPQQAVVEFRSLLSGTRPTPLAADRKLETKKVYVMLPMKRGKVATLSDDEARQVLLSAKSVLRSGSLWSFTGILPLFAQICPAGREPVVLRRKDKVMEKEEKSNNTDLLSGVLDERPEYLTKQFSGKGWKPTLDTIKEKGVDNKIPHWLFHTGKSSERIIL